jgi:hypothetical protein
MRLMLGKQGCPELLVEVDEKHTHNWVSHRRHFAFWVVNGAWKGTFTDGVVEVFTPYSKEASLVSGVEVLTDNQDRLRGDYQTVFENFDNPDYVAPHYPSFKTRDHDDIPF